MRSAEERTSAAHGEQVEDHGVPAPLREAESARARAEEEAADGALAGAERVGEEPCWVRRESSVQPLASPAHHGFLTSLCECARFVGVQVEKRGDGRRREKGLGWQGDMCSCNAAAERI